MNKDMHIDGHILNVVNSETIEEQVELQQQLQKRGYDIPQATLSRRLKKLNIAKVSGVYKIVEYNRPYIPVILTIKISKLGLIVVHTHPGNASSLAYFFDQKYVAEGVLLGTIAGDDTVLLIVESKEGFAFVLERIREDFPYLDLS